MCSKIQRLHPHQCNPVMTVPLNYKCFCVPPCLWVSPHITEPNPTDLVINDQNATKSYNFPLQISLWLRFFFVLCGTQGCSPTKTGAAEERANFPLHWDSPSWFHQTGYKRSDTRSVQLAVRFINSWNERDPRPGVICFSLWRRYRWQMHKRALLLRIPSKGLWTLYISHFSICLTMYMIWAKRMFRKDKY